MHAGPRAVRQPLATPFVPPSQEPVPPPPMSTTTAEPGAGTRHARRAPSQGPSPPRTRRQKSWISWVTAALIARCFLHFPFNRPPVPPSLSSSLLLFSSRSSSFLSLRSSQPPLVFDGVLLLVVILFLSGAGYPTLFTFRLLRSASRSLFPSPDNLPTLFLQPKFCVLFSDRYFPS